MHRREKVSLTDGAKNCRFIDYMVKYKNFRLINNIILSEKCRGQGLMAPWEPAYSQYNARKTICKIPYDHYNDQLYLAIKLYIYVYIYIYIYIYI